MSNTDGAWAFEQYEAVRASLPSARFPSRSEKIVGIDRIVERFNTVLLDAFGVLNIGDTAIPGATEFIAALRAKGRRVCIVSNSASVPTPVSLQKFKRLGFDFSLDEIVTSRDALKVGLQSAAAINWGVMATSTSDIDELASDCFRLSDDQASFDRAEGFVLLGSGEWTDGLQSRLVESIRSNPRPVFVGNPDIVAPREDGLSREPGYYAHNLAQRTGCSLAFFGKPFSNIFDFALSRIGAVENSGTVMVGDTLHTDVLGGAAYGFKTLLIRDYGLFAGHEIEPFISRSGIRSDYTLDHY